ncbi:hypothetical protein AMST5_00981 [freshwater sediment metagenome]|uniref:Uncharacterized protein n=1 Tax=freshwater sediment metagenome TaxID=556182 RepID=A0AA48LYK7_9ZZZZ
MAMQIELDTPNPSTVARLCGYVADAMPNWNDEDISLENEIKIERLTALCRRIASLEINEADYALARIVTRHWPHKSEAYWAAITYTETPFILEQAWQSLGSRARYYRYNQIAKPCASAEEVNRVEIASDEYNDATRNALLQYLVERNSVLRDIEETISAVPEYEQKAEALKHTRAFRVASERLETIIRERGAE